MPGNVGALTFSLAVPTSTTRVRCQADRTYLWLAGALFIGLLLRVHCLVYPYLWLDEYVTLWSIGGGSYGEMLDRAQRWTASGPLFVLCYRASCDLVGNVDWGLKLPGVIGGTAAIWVSWWTALRLFRRDDVALVAAWFVSLAPQFIHFSQEARPYMLGSLLVLGATGFLGSWIESGRRSELAAVVALSLAAVGFHLLCALALVAQNVVVLCTGVCRRWHMRRWFEWGVAQSGVVMGLWFVGSQFGRLSRRHGSMLLETALPMPTRLSLNHGLWGQFQVEITVALIVLAIWCCARKFPSTELANAWNKHQASVWLAAASYCIPTGLLTLLSAVRIIDCWPRYYFLFHSGVMLAFAWLVVGVFPRTLSRLLFAVVLAGSVTQFNCVNGMPSCRLNSAWKDFGAAERTLQQRFSREDLLLSRSGLIESNHLSFLLDPVGASYLKCFCEARTGVLAAEHLPLPFSAEGSQAQQYLEKLFADCVFTRRDFWVANIGTTDFDYNDWITSRFGSAFEKTEEVIYPMISLTHYVNAAMPGRSSD
jgi:hypothetical protein